MKGMKDQQQKEEIPGVVYSIQYDATTAERCTLERPAERQRRESRNTRLGNLDKTAVAEHPPPDTM